MNANSNNGSMSRPSTKVSTSGVPGGPKTMHWLRKTGSMNLSQPQGESISKKPTAGK